MLVAVTGASGFIGVHACAELARRGYRVRALVRRPCGAWPCGVEERLVPELSPAHVTPALRDVEAVVHLAGRAHVLAETAADPDAEFRGVNVDGTGACIDAAIDAGAREFLFLSSVAAARGPGDAVLDETCTPQPTTAYGRSKLEAEELVRSRGSTGGLRTIILRPPMVYGPGMKGNPLRLFRLIARGVPLPLGRVRNLRSFLYVGNLVHALADLMNASSGAAQDTFYLTDGENLSTPDFIRRAAEALHKPARLVPLPTSILRLAGELGDALSRFGRVPVTSHTLESLTGTLILDDRRLREALPYRSPYSVRTGLEMTANWFLRTDSR